MANTQSYDYSAPAQGGDDAVKWSGLFWLGLAVLGAAVFFWDGLDALLSAWKLPEYSHGPLIPVLSGLLFLRHMKVVPVRPGPLPNRWPGVVLIVISLAFAALGKLANIDDVVAYGLILWVGGILLVSWGWKQGWQYWPGVLHLVYMLPLPGVIYYKLSTYLQFISSELGVWFLRLLAVPVFLDGNIIDLGVYKLHVAEACSGLRYLFPILSFSYIFAVLYRGPWWHKAILLISAAPITVLMNSVRIAIAGYIVNSYGTDWVEGFTHFFEGWVIFLICVAILFFLAWLLVFLNPAYNSVVDALDLDTDGLLPQIGRLRFTYPSWAMITAAVVVLGASAAWQALPDRGERVPERSSFALFPQTFGPWEQIGPRQSLTAAVERTLGADDYHQISLARPGHPEVGLFMAWYGDQSQGGVHSPEICLPGAGWEIAWLDRTDMTERLGYDRPFNINRAIIQKGEVRMMVYYWFEQKGRSIAWDFSAKFWLMWDGVATGRTDGALVRLTSMIGPDETDEAAEARLFEVMQQVLKPLPQFIPE